MLLYFMLPVDAADPWVQHCEPINKRHKFMAAGRKSKQRDYEYGFLSRSQLGTKLGIKAPSWTIIQKALVRAGYLRYSGTKNTCVLTDKAENLAYMHKEINDQGHIKEWHVWSPRIVDLIREDVAWVMANPSPTKSVSVEYADGYMSVTTLAKKLEKPVFDVVDLMIEWELATRDAKNNIVATDDGQYSRLHEDIDGRGRAVSWFIWAPALLDEFTNYYLRKATEPAK